MSSVDIARQEVAERVSPTEISALPLNGRNYLDLALLAPGVNRTNIRNTERFAETSAVPGTGLSVLGQRNIGNTFVVDGVSGNDDAADLAGTYLSQEVIREFQVITNGASAEFGRSTSGAFNIVTQSGANRTNGSAYGFFRDDRFDARNAFRDVPGSAVAAAVRRDARRAHRPRSDVLLSERRADAERADGVHIDLRYERLRGQSGTGWSWLSRTAHRHWRVHDRLRHHQSVRASGCTADSPGTSSPGATACMTSPARTRAASAV